MFKFSPNVFIIIIIIWEVFLSLFFLLNDHNFVGFIIIIIIIWKLKKNKKIKKKIMERNWHHNFVNVTPAYNIGTFHMERYIYLIKFYIKWIELIEGVISLGEMLQSFIEVTYFVLFKSRYFVYSVVFESINISF